LPCALRRCSSRRPFMFLGFARVTNVCVDQRPFKFIGFACLSATSALSRRRRCRSCRSRRRLLRHFKCQRPSCFLRRQSCRCLPRLPCHFRPDDGLSHFSDLRVSATSALSRRRRCRSQRRLSCHSECRRPCCFWRRRSCRFRRQRPCRCRLQCRSPRTPTAVLLPAPMVVPMLAPTAVTYSTNGRAASAFCADISSGRVDPVADGRADSGTNGGAVPGVVARAESTRRMSVGKPPTPVGCADLGVVVAHADPAADDRAASIADDRAVFVANGGVVAGCSAVLRAHRLPCYFRRRWSWRYWPRLPSLPVPTAELPPAPVFVPLPRPTTELISRGSSLVLMSCIERMSRRRCLSQCRLSCHLQCQRPCRFLRRTGPCADGRAATRAD
jgi:hypothetical protein